MMADRNGDQDDDFVLLVLVTQAGKLLLEDNVKVLESPLAAHMREQRHLNTALPCDKVRVTWDLFKGKVTSRHFRRVFRMEEACFEQLCLFLASKLGEEVFRSEAFIAAKYSSEACTVP